jgi:lysophospholipase L1-like esterase
MRSPHLVIGLLVLLLGGAHAAEVDCRLPRDIIEDDPRLAATAERLRAKEPLTIVAIGGASTAGIAAGEGGQWAYPRRLEEALRRRVPGVAITVLNKAVPRQTAQQMIDRFAKDVIPAEPTLVIWETGTVDAVRGADVETFAAAVQDGIAALRQNKSDVLLVNMQYNPDTESVINFGPYLEALRHSADLADVYVFRRFEAMKYWSENGVFNFVDVPKDAREGLARDVYRCLGDALAEAILYAVR